MGVKLILSILLVITILLAIGLFFSVSCTCETEEKPAMPTIYIVEEPQVQTYVVGEENTLSWVEESSSKRHELNKIRSLREDQDDQELFEIQSKLRNVRRIVDHEVIVGYDEDLDDIRWIEVDS